MTEITEDPTQQRCPKCGLRMKLMETRKTSVGGVRRRFVCMGGCGHSLHTVESGTFIIRPDGSLGREGETL